jgi:uncharacterized protein
MTGYLLDVNVLIALMWPAHQAYETVQQWFHLQSAKGWATCPITQTAFVRIISNPAFSSDAVEPLEAVTILQANLKHPHHQFWPDNVSLPAALHSFSGHLVGHRQVTDAYLLALALHRNGRLVTLDRGVLDLLPDKKMRRDLVVIL